jgi:glycosyltransferase involved in cell wall biosynthesis
MKQIVTIDMCLHNCENTLPKAIKSISDQDFPHEKMQLLFVDDGSKDRTLKIVEVRVSKMDIQTKVFKTEWRGLSLETDTRQRGWRIHNLGRRRRNTNTKLHTKTK